MDPPLRWVRALAKLLIVSVSLCIQYYILNIGYDSVKVKVPLYILETSVLCCSAAQIEEWSLSGLIGTVSSIASVSYRGHGL